MILVLCALGHPTRTVRVRSPNARALRGEGSRTNPMKNKLSRNIFWASSDHLVTQKSIFWKKISKKVANAVTPPCLATAVIYVNDDTFSKNTE